MPLSTDRLPLCHPEFFREAVPDKEFLERALKAVKHRRGLIHGTLKDHLGRVCAIGALANTLGYQGSLTARVEIIRPLQEYNDSMPKVTPVARRKAVIKWIEARLKQLAKMSH